MISKELIIRGNKSDQIIQYFEGVALSYYHKAIKFMTYDEPQPEGIGKFKYIIKTSDWSVDLTEDKEIYIGSMVFPEVIVRINANENIIDQLIYDFRIQFLSAGG